MTPFWMRQVHNCQKKLHEIVTRKTCQIAHENQLFQPLPHQQEVSKLYF